MRRRGATAVLFVLALTPSAWLAWRWRDMPQLGLHQDDALYLVGAKSLAQGHGYRIESLPGSPFQTKYPPALSILLAGVWKFGRPFPENLRAAMALTWVMLPLCLVAMRAVFRQFGFAPREVWLLTYAAAWYPMTCLLSTTIMSELLFLALGLTSLWMAEKALDRRAPGWLALAAGLLAGGAYLTRTAGMVVALTCPICFAARKQVRRGLWFLAGMLPAVAGWQVWVSAHALDTRDPALLYYTNYLAAQLATVRLDNLPSVLWYNLDAFLRTVGKLVVFDVAIGENVHFERILGAVAIAGAVRLVKRGRCIQYAAAAGGMTALLLVYHYTADERLALLLYPLVLMGFWTEVKNCVSAIRASWKRGSAAERAASTFAAAVVGGAGLFVAASYAVGVAAFLPAVYRQCGRELKSHEAAYQWIRTQTAPESTFYAYNDSVLYLHTERRALGLTMPSGRIYTGHGARETDAFIRAIPERIREHHLEHALVTSADFDREGRERLLEEVARRDPSLRKEFTTKTATVYRVVP